jgi:NADP-dependent 3-hydroxy acid dehydrogenase YdfG
MKPTPVQLRGAVAAVTGGARGIGRATAEALARAGARVAIGDLDADLARSAAEGLPGDAVGLELDVTSRASFESFLDETEAALGRLAVLVNNAGLMYIARLVEEDDALTARQVDVNLNGVLFGVKLAVPRMIEHGRGHVVNIASAAGKGGYAGAATYCATKHAVVGLTEALRGELTGTPVNLSLVMPGAVRTELTSGMPEVRGARPVEPEDVASAIVRAIERPRFEVFVPRSIGRASRLLAAMPDPLRQAVRRYAKADEVLFDADLRARAAYLARTTPVPRDADSARLP